MPDEDCLYKSFSIVTNGYNMTLNIAYSPQHDVGKDSLPFKAIVEFSLNHSFCEINGLQNLQLKTRPVSFTRGELKSLGNYLKDHIEKIKIDPNSISNVYLNYDTAYQIQAFEGGIDADGNGAFSIECMINIAKVKDIVPSTYLGAISQIQVNDAKRFSQELLDFLDSECMMPQPDEETIMIKRVCVLETSGYIATLYVRSLDHSIQYLGIATTLLVPTDLDSIPIKSIATSTTIKDLYKFISYLEHHIECLREDSNYESPEFLTYDKAFQVQALSGSISQDGKGVFTLRFMLNVGCQTNKRGTSTYAGAEAEVTFDEIHTFTASIREVLAEAEILAFT